jgi:pimeloyl-ACP methyl ester carboxylesterase
MHEEALDVLPRLRTALSIERPVLIGHSTGASMALLHAAAGRWSVAGVVAMSPFAFVEASNLDAIATARDAYASTDWRAKLARHHDDVDGVFRAWAGTWLDPAFRSWSILEDLRGLRAPVLTILGENDPYSTPAQCDAIARAATQVEVLRIADCGHVPWRERPEIVVPATAAFVARVAPAHGKPRFER